MQFHGGVYRSDDAGESWHDIAPGLPSDFGFPLAIDPADPDSAYVIPLVADMDRVTPEGRVRVYETRDAGASWTPRGDGLPPEHAYLTILREAFDWAGEGDGARALLRRDLGRRLRVGRRGRELVRRGDAPAARAIGLRRLERKRKSMSKRPSSRTRDPGTSPRPLPRCARGCPSRSPRSPRSPTTTAGRGRPAGRSCSPRSTRSAGSCAPATRSGSCRRPIRTRLAELAADAGLPRAAGRARGGRQRRGRRADHGRRRDPRAPGRLLLRRVRDPRLAAGVLRRPRRARRRHPQGGLRPPAAAGRRSGSCTATATSASASTARAGSTSTGSTPIPPASPPRSSPATTASR